MTNEDIEDLNRGGHDPKKVYNGYKKAYGDNTKPTVILAFTIKGYGIGSRQADNTTHQVKKLSDENIKDFIKKFDLPVTYEPDKKLEFIDIEDQKDLKEYLLLRREKLGGFIPKRTVSEEPLRYEKDTFSGFDDQSTREQSTTMIFVRMLTKLMRDKNIGERVVPIVPDKLEHLVWTRYLGSLVSTHQKAKNMSQLILTR